MPENKRWREETQKTNKRAQKVKKRHVVHLCLPKIIVDHSEVKAEVFHVAFIALEEK